MRQEDHPKFAFQPIHEIFFDNNDHENDKGKPPHVPLASPAALASSTIQYLHGQSPNCLQHFTMDTPRL
jgi:hypothetical protein